MTFFVVPVLLLEDVILWRNKAFAHRHTNSIWQGLGVGQEKALPNYRYGGISIIAPKRPYFLLNKYMFKLLNFEFNFAGPSFPFKFWKKKISKSNAFILFVDDEVFPVVDNLIKAGWSVKRIRDISNPQDDDVKRAHIIFVDYKGVGRTLSEGEEGIGIIKILKDEYKNSKRVILYSGYSRFSLGPHLGVADNQLSKESSTYEFIEMIESELKKLR